MEKIDETRTKVQAMTVELEETRVKVAEFQRQCEEYLVVIVQQKQVKRTYMYTRTQPHSSPTRPPSPPAAGC